MTVGRGNPYRTSSQHILLLPPTLTGGQNILKFDLPCLSCRPPRSIEDSSGVPQVWPVQRVPGRRITGFLKTFWWDGREDFWGTAQNVLRLQVPVHDALPVRFFQAIHHLPQNPSASSNGTAADAASARYRSMTLRRVSPSTYSIEICATPFSTKNSCTPQT